MQLLTYWVAYSHLIPISLYVCMEILKMGLAFLITKDEGIRDITHSKVSHSYAKARTSDLIEELGQVIS